MIKAAFFDIDGTLLGSDHKVPASAWAAIRAMRANGIKTVISTGRAINEMPEELLHGFDAYVLTNGQYCYDDAGMFRDVHIDDDDARAIVEQAKAGLFDVIVQLRDTAFTNRISPALRAVSDMVGLEYEVDDLDRALTEPVYQFNVMVDAASEDSFLSRTKHVRATRWCESFCDVIPADGGKHHGVRAALERFGIAPEEAIAFGDGDNDLSMFEVVGTSVAMGNAWDAVKACATHVTTSVDDDGIRNACVELGLI